MKKGFTLIEVTITIALISIISTASFASVKGFKELKDEFEINYSANSVIQFINCCKSFSRNNSYSTHIMIVEKQGELQLYLDAKKINYLRLPKGIKITCNDVDRDIKINNFGRLGDACTIFLNNNRGKTKEITLKVGTGYVSEKK